MTRRRRRKCQHCRRLYQPDPRNRWHQKYCSEPACQQASKRASYRHWARSALGRRYARRPEQSEDVRIWRAAHPGYWKRSRKKPVALPDVLMPQPLTPSGDKPKLIEVLLANLATLLGQFPLAAANFDALKPLALPDVLFTQSSAWFGLVSMLMGGALPEDIASFTRQAILRGQEIQGRMTPGSAAHVNSQASHLPSAAAPGAAAVQLGGSPAGSG